MPAAGRPSIASIARMDPPGPIARAINISRPFASMTGLPSVSAESSATHTATYRPGGEKHRGRQVGQKTVREAEPSVGCSRRVRTPHQRRLESPSSSRRDRWRRRRAESVSAWRQRAPSAAAPDKMADQSGTPRTSAVANSIAASAAYRASVPTRKLAAAAISVVLPARRRQDRARQGTPWPAAPAQWLRRYHAARVSDVSSMRASCQRPKFKLRGEMSIVRPIVRQKTPGVAAQAGHKIVGAESREDQRVPPGSGASTGPGGSAAGRRRTHWLPAPHHGPSDNMVNGRGASDAPAVGSQARPATGDPAAS